MLTHSGKISAKLAEKHALTEFQKYRIIQDRLYQSDFDRFVLEENEIVVPFYRKDIENKYDIAEEMARIYGYNNIKSTMLKGTHFSKSSNYLKFKNVNILHFD